VNLLRRVNDYVTLESVHISQKTFNTNILTYDLPTAIHAHQKNQNVLKNDFQYGGWNPYTLQCRMSMTLISPGDCTMQCGMWLWDHDSEFTKWQHPAM